MTRERDYPKFGKSQRSTFRYWFWHWRAFNSVALELGVWRPKYLLHDIEKPFMRLFMPYKKVQKFHRSHNRHHLEYPGGRDWTAMFVDWECSRYTKEGCPLAALGEARMKRKDGTMTGADYRMFMAEAVRIKREYRRRWTNRMLRRERRKKAFSAVRGLLTGISVPDAGRPPKKR